MFMNIYILFCIELCTYFAAFFDAFLSAFLFAWLDRKLNSAKISHHYVQFMFSLQTHCSTLAGVPFSLNCAYHAYTKRILYNTVQIMLNML